MTEKRQGYERRLEPACLEVQGLISAKPMAWAALGTKRMLETEAAYHIQSLLELVEKQDFKAGCYRITITALPQSVEDSRWKAPGKG